MTIISSYKFKFSLKDANEQSTNATNQLIVTK